MGFTIEVAVGSGVVGGSGEWRRWVVVIVGDMWWVVADAVI